MIPVEEAWNRIAAALPKLGTEIIPLSHASGRVLAESILARVTQPPSAISAMDGYALRAADTVDSAARLRVVGIVAAGALPAQEIGAGEAMRIFTGAPLPPGADAVLIQENALLQECWLTALSPIAVGKNIRPAGLDFKAGDLLIAAGKRLSPRDVGLAAAANYPTLKVHRRPRVAILATGNEIVLPGDPMNAGQIIGSNSHALAALIAEHGGDPIIAGIAPDDPEALSQSLRTIEGADMLVTSGGASVGDHDLVKKSLIQAGMSLSFWQIAMRPGKPLMFGDWHGKPVLGLPGNPVSALVCATLFLGPILRRMQGEDAALPPTQEAFLGRDLPANDHRQDYLRASLERDSSGDLTATPFAVQDSSMLTLMARADALIVRKPHDPALTRGTRIRVLIL